MQDLEVSGRKRAEMVHLFKPTRSRTMLPLGARIL